MLGYRLEDRLDDPWTSRFAEFKFDPTEASVEGGIRLLAHAASLVTRGLAVERFRTLSAPALRSTEWTASPDGMLRRAARCRAEASDCRFMASLLEKQSHLRVTTNNGRAATRSICVDCGARKFRIGVLP